MGDCFVSFQNDALHMFVPLVIVFGRVLLVHTWYYRYLAFCDIKFNRPLDFPFMEFSTVFIEAFDIFGCCDNLTENGVVRKETEVCFDVAYRVVKVDEGEGRTLSFEGGQRRRYFTFPFAMVTTAVFFRH